jgi:UDP:flavonoid glycosyltransferase YjiC (YdhE family)
VYLQVQPWLDTVLTALEASGAEVIAVIPDLSWETANRHRGLRLYRQPVRLLPLLAGCTLAITHAGHGTALNCLLAGVPMLLLPQHIEQLMITERVAAMGAGLGILPAYVETGFHAVLHDLLGNPKYRNAARTIAVRHHSVPRDRALEEVTGLMEDALAQRR